MTKYWGIKGIVEFCQVDDISVLKVLGMTVYRKVGKVKTVLGITTEEYTYEWFNEFMYTKGMPEIQKDFLRQYKDWEEFQDAFIECVGKEYAISVGLITIPDAVAKMMEGK